MIELLQEYVYLGNGMWLPNILPSRLKWYLRHTVLLYVIIEILSHIFPSLHRNSLFDIGVT